MWPEPREQRFGSTILWLAETVQLTIVPAQPSLSEFDQHWHGVQRALTPRHTRARGRHEGEQYIRMAFERIKTSIFAERYVPEKFHPINHDFDPPIQSDRKYINTVEVELHETPGGVDYSPSEEAYTLEVTELGATKVCAVTYLGVLHALQTFRQLFLAHTDVNQGLYLPNGPVSIKDSPRFEHRGLNLDIARNRIYPKDVLRTLDAMAAQKLNYLHLHATDSQSWPLDIPSMPELAAKGAYHRSQIWSKEHLELVQSFGAERGIEVYLEIDMPGHTGSIVHSHPELVIAYGKKWDVYALEPPAGQFKLADPAVQAFLTKLLSDLLPRLHSSKFHIGGDELNLKSYELETDLKTSDREKLRPYVQAFVDHVLQTLESRAITPIAWEEILVDWNLKLPQSTIIQSWRNQHSLSEITAKGHRALFGPSSHWYLDTGLGGWADPEPNNPDTKVRFPFPDWCPPFKNWRLIYSYNPLKGVPPERHHLILGGEAHLWCELTDSITLDGMLWPRLAAVAEVLWCGPCEVNESATRRLAEVRERLVGRGIAAGMVQMEWALQNKGGAYL